MRNFEANTISVEDVLHTLRECDLDSRFEGAFDHIVAFASELTGLSEDFLIDKMYEKQAIDFSKVSFRDFDDTALPVQFFFGYDITHEQREELVGSLGYRKEDCMNFELVLDVYEKKWCPLEAVLTFADAAVRWVDIADSTDELDSFIQIIRETDTERAREAMECLKETLGGHIQEEKVSGERQINWEKLVQYLADEMILEFASPEECMEFFNVCDGQDFKTVEDMKQYQGEYGFGLDGRWYHVDFDEALDVWEDASLKQKNHYTVMQTVEGESLSPGVVKELTDELRREVMERYWWARHEMNGIAGYEGFDSIAEQLERKFYISELQVCAADHGFYLDANVIDDVIPGDLDLYMKQLKTHVDFLQEHGLWPGPKPLEAQVMNAETLKKELGKVNIEREIERD